LRTVSEIDKARTAMAIDCEGNISLYMNVNNDGSPRISLDVRVVNTSYTLPEKLYEIWKVGHVRCHPNRTFQNGKDVYEWQVQDRDSVQWILRSVEKYLIIKQRQAALLLEAISFLNICKPRKWGGTGSPYSSGDKERIREFVMTCHVLNSRGKMKKGEREK